ncbi:MAG: glycosyltransferase [Campylobacteraceae bacterium]|jgi:glycosyltransferase involved in cell wall biosynthesis|nr:glycosyltransferase [Campylobacteraceae bacterium]
MVSIITPSHNSSKFIAQTIESVLAQTYERWEMLIVDDMSSDNSIDIIKKYLQTDKRIRLIKLQNNVGPALARNKAIEIANGKYIAFLDSDDTWLPNKLQVQIQFMRDNNLLFSYSAYNIIDENNNHLKTFHVKNFVSYKELLKTNIIGCLTAIYDAEKLGKIFMINTGHEDYVLWLDILKKIGYAKGINEPLACYRIVKKSVSSNKLKVVMYQWNIYRKIEKLSFFKSIYYILFYAYNGIKKYNFRLKE